MALDAQAGTEKMETEARQRGDQQRLAGARIGPIPSLVELGRWQEALDRAAEADELRASPWARAEVISTLPVFCERGDIDAARRLFDEYEWMRDAEQVELAVSHAAQEARLQRALDQPGKALTAAERGLAHTVELGISNKGIKTCLVEAVEASFEENNLLKVEELLQLVDNLQPGELTPLLQAHRTRFHARLDARRGNRQDDVDDNYRIAETVFATHGISFHHAATQLEHAEWLTSQGRPDDARPLLAEAQETLKRLGAEPRLERLAAAQASTTEIPA